MTTERLKLRQLNAKIQRLTSLTNLKPPAKGWISEVRRALGMSARQLATRLGVSQPAVSQFEKGEIDGTITLESLRKAAAALECDLVYALVPRDSLEDIRERQAHGVATRMVERVAHSMRLEKQDVSEEATAKQIDELAQQLLAGPARSLWDEA